MHLTFVDLDDTLFKTCAKIHIVKDSIIVKKLSTQEFNRYKLNEGETFDFSEFESTEIFKLSEPLKNNIEKIVNLYNNSEVAILTARGDFDNKDELLQFLRTSGIPAGHYQMGEIHVIRCADSKLSPPEAKVNKINKILSKRPDITSISLIDDSYANLKAVAKIKQVPIDLYHANEDKITKYEIDNEDRE